MLLFQGHGMLFIYPQIQSGFHSSDGNLLWQEVFTFSHLLSKGFIGIQIDIQKLLSHTEQEKKIEEEMEC